MLRDPAGMKTLFSWSSGKDCAWALNEFLSAPVPGDAILATTFDESSTRIAMHGVPLELAQAQAEALGLPFWSVGLPWPCANDVYESRMLSLLKKAEAASVTQIVFADLFLEDIRKYRETKMVAFPAIKLCFPLWMRPTRELAEVMINGGLKAVVVCVDPKRLPREFVGREFDHSFLRDLPPGIDPCGECGEFHTFCYDLPSFKHPVRFKRASLAERHGFVYQELQAG